MVVVCTSEADLVDGALGLEELPSGVVDFGIPFPILPDGNQSSLAQAPAFKWLWSVLAKLIWLTELWDWKNFLLALVVPFPIHPDGNQSSLAQAPAFKWLWSVLAKLIWLTELWDWKGF